MKIILKGSCASLSSQDSDIMSEPATSVPISFAQFLLHRLPVNADGCPGHGPGGTDREKL